MNEPTYLRKSQCGELSRLFSVKRRALTRLVDALRQLEQPNSRTENRNRRLAAEGQVTAQALVWKRARRAYNEYLSKPILPKRHAA